MEDGGRTELQRAILAYYDSFDEGPPIRGYSDAVGVTKIWEAIRKGRGMRGAHGRVLNDAFLS